LLNFFIPISSLLTFCIVYLYKDTIAKKFRLVDIPNKILKLHKNKIPIIGGLILLIHSISILIFIFFNQKNYIEFFILTILISILGLLDDIYKISPNKKILILTLFLSLFFIKFPQLKIGSLIIETLNYKFILLEKNIFINLIFTILCYLLIINAYNMSDGHDGIAVGLGLIWFLYILIFKSSSIIIVLSIIIILILFFYYNIKSKIFLGDSGNYFISSLVAGLIINQNNYSKNFSAEEIFILFILPGIDMLRLFILRIYRKKNPFKGDREHFHHYLSKKFNKITTTLIYLACAIAPIILYKINLFKSYIIIIFIISLYCLSLRFFLKK
jgi:UDP-GlcNAc:undecaprenyl-phosphate GlcNAc-1-phosphate transferase